MQSKTFLEWGYERIRSGTLADRPEGLVSPVECSPAVQRRFVNAVAWWLFHETGHVLENHDGPPSTKYEREADDFATKYMIEGRGLGEREEAMMGIATAIFALIFRDATIGRITDKVHPPSPERLLTALQELDKGVDVSYTGMCGAASGYLDLICKNYNIRSRLELLPNTQCEMYCHALSARLQELGQQHLDDSGGEGKGDQ